jgi:excisionase family DNA binding protein
MKRTGSENSDTLPLSQRLLARPEEAAELLGVGRSTIYELMRVGELPVVHIGRAARIPVQELRYWVETHETPTFHAHEVPQVHERPLHLP